ncbi:MAG TPA: DUF2169 domain-containing protein [Bryobacteraceae bacterium]|nr:DUF2169 domain-containing protein [Bryobacteraceae bacterium]
MSAARPPIPQPTPASKLPPPEVPPSLQQPPPGPVRVVALSPEPGVYAIGIVFKRTYVLSHGQPCRPADEQIPLDPEGAFHEPIAEGVAPSYKSLPEIIALKTGTDVVVQANACSRQPVKLMRVALRIGQHVHEAAVFGRRFCHWRNGTIVFSDPEPFESLPLRYENAYGGRDLVFEQAVAAEVKQRMAPNEYRQMKSTAGAFVQANHPLMYPRNRFGKGYIIENRQEAVEGRELPNLERPGDRLTPERIVLGNPFDWDKQPIPIGFDFLDPMSFPRTAMLGFPPPSTREISAAREAVAGMVPPDFYRGSIFTTSPDKISEIVHADAGRCASLGLRFPFLRGDEQMVLSGMDAAIPDFIVQLPGEVPAFGLQSPDGSFSQVPQELHTVFIDVPRRILTLIWAGRMRIAKPMQPGTDLSLTSAAQVRMMRP